MNTRGLNKTIIGWLNYEYPPSDIPMCDFEKIRYEIRPGDIILIEGRSRVSSVIRLITASPWTHAALYIGRLHDIEDPELREVIKEYYPCEPNEQIIIESVLGRGTIANSVSYYKKDHIRICRPKGLSYKDAQEVIRYAVGRLGAGYDVRQILDLARFLFPWVLLPRRWRSSLFQAHPGRSTRTVCSTMIAEAFGSVQFPILPLVKKSNESGVQLFRSNPKLCVPRDFDYSPYFEIIKYPFIDFAFHSNYRLLPWKGNNVLSEIESQLYVQEPNEAEILDTDELKSEPNVDSKVQNKEGQMSVVEVEEEKPKMSNPEDEKNGKVSDLTVENVAEKIEEKEHQEGRCDVQEGEASNKVRLQRWLKGMKSGNADRSP